MKISISKSNPVVLLASQFAESLGLSEEGKQHILDTAIEDILHQELMQKQ